MMLANNSLFKIKVILWFNSVTKMLLNLFNSFLRSLFIFERNPQALFRLNFHEKHYSTARCYLVNITLGIFDDVHNLTSFLDF